MMFTRQITVRFDECDGLGHVNNGRYFSYMEDARIDVFRLFNPSLDLANWNLIVASTRCDFLRQVKFGETLTVNTWIGRIGNSSFQVEHALQNAADEWVARGQATLIYYNYAAGKPEHLSEEHRQNITHHSAGPSGVPDLR